MIPETLTDNTGRVWYWSDSQDGYSAEGVGVHGYDEINSNWGILIDHSLDFHPNRA